MIISLIIFNIYLFNSLFYSKSKNYISKQTIKNALTMLSSRLSLDSIGSSKPDDILNVLFLITSFSKNIE